jgi:FkbM family methyltransferase
MAKHRIERWFGLVRSLIIYWRPGRQRGLQELYRPFVGAGDLAFDVGAHLGDRTHAFRKLGARVVALEPQPAVRRWLEFLVGRSRDVSIRSEAVGRAVGTARLALSHRTPSMSSLAEDWPGGLSERNPAFRGVSWDDSVTVPVTTLDALIEQYGLPRFCKIDVEGYEAEVLEGLSHRIPALSVEFVVGALDVAEACVRRLESLGEYEFNAVEGEGRKFMSKRWLGADEMVAWLEGGRGNVSSGDVYARLRGETDTTGDGESNAGAGEDGHSDRTGGHSSNG